MSSHEEIMVDTSLQGWLIGTAVVIPIALILLNVAFLRHYLHRDLEAGNWIGKIGAIIAMLVSECAVLLLPFDVGNRSGLVGCHVYAGIPCGGLDTAGVWQAVYLIIALLVVMVIPFGIFYFETEESTVEQLRSGPQSMALRANLCGCSKRLTVAGVYTGITTVVSIVILLITWAFLSTTQIPYQATKLPVSTAGAWYDASITVTSAMNCGKGSCKFSDETLDFQVTFLVYLGALLSFVGWFLFVIYGGIGLVGLPLDLIMSFVKRPKVLTPAQVRKRKEVLRQNARNVMVECTALGKEMVEFAGRKSVSWRERREQRAKEATDMNRVRVLVEHLEEEWEAIRLGDPRSFREFYNPIVPYVKLVGGIFGIIISLLWVIHIIVYMLIDPPAALFLNEYFNFWDTFASFIGTISIGILALYLLAAVVKGNTKLGSRFFIIKIHPMVYQETQLNSIYFNLILVLLCTLPVVQFCTEAFASYARLTDASLVFGSQMKNLRFFEYFFRYNVFVYLLLLFVLLSIIYFSIWPSEAEYLKDVLKTIRTSAEKEITGAERRVAAHGGALTGATTVEAIELSKGKSPETHTEWK